MPGHASTKDFQMPLKVKLKAGRRSICWKAGLFSWRAGLFSLLEESKQILSLITGLVLDGLFLDWLHDLSVLLPAKRQGRSGSLIRNFFLGQPFLDKVGTVSLWHTHQIRNKPRG